MLTFADVLAFRWLLLTPTLANFADTLFTLCLQRTIMESLEKWFTVVENHIKQFEAPDANTETTLTKLKQASTLWGGIGLQGLLGEF